MLQLHSENKRHTKQAQALKLVFRQAELGLGELPRSYGELQEKVASLCNQDLSILEKAVELSMGNTSFGSVHNNDLQDMNSSQQFLATMLGEL